MEEPAQITHTGESSDYLLIEKMANIGIYNGKQNAFIKAPVTSNILWKQAQVSGGFDLAAALSPAITTNKQVDLTLNVDTAESIVPWTIQARYNANFVIGNTHQANWRLYAQATGGAPPGLPAGAIGIKPTAAADATNATKAINDNGIRLPKLCFNAQWHSIQCQLPNDKVIDNTHYGKARSVGDHISKEVLNHFVNSTGRVDRCPDYRNDWEGAVVPDQFFTFRRTIRISDGQQPQQMIERLGHKLTERRQGLYQAMDPQTASYQQWPAGMSMKLLLQTRSSAEQRLKIGTCSQWIGGAWVPDVPVYLSLTECEIDYLAVTMSPDKLKIDRTLAILGSDGDPNVVDADGRVKRIDTARYLFCDIAEKRWPLQQNATAINVRVNDNASDVLPHMVMAFVNKRDVWDMEKLAGDNYYLWNFAAEEVWIKKLKPTCGGGSADRPIFLDQFPGADINTDTHHELTIIGDNWATTALTPIERWDAPLAAQMAAAAANTWYKFVHDNNALECAVTKLPREKIVAFHTDMSSIVLRDASNGADASTLQMLIEFDKAIPGADYELTVMNFYKHNQVFTRKPMRTFNEVPLYTVNQPKSGLAYGAHS